MLWRTLKHNTSHTNSVGPPPGRAALWEAPWNCPPCQCPPTPGAQSYRVTPLCLSVTKPYGFQVFYVPRNCLLSQPAVSTAPFSSRNGVSWAGSICRTLLTVLCTSALRVGPHVCKTPAQPHDQSAEGQAENRAGAQEQLLFDGSHQASFSLNLRNSSEVPASRRVSHKQAWSNFCFLKVYRS